MAQRAYRQRKESTIDGLKQKVAELEKSKEMMGLEFVNLTEMILQHRLVKDSPEIAEHIKQSTLNILRDAQDAEKGNDLRQRNEDQPMAVESPEVFGAAPATSLLADQEDFFDFSMLDSEGQPDLAVPSISTIGIENYSNGPPADPHPRASSHAPHVQTQSWHMDCGLPEVPQLSSLHCPRSYAAQERTFGRRLHRASQEVAFLLASMKNPPPIWYSKVFGFCLHFETRAEIRERLGDTLRKARDVTLNNWRYPFTNLGGAGLFYPHQTHENSGQLPIGNRCLQHEAYKPSYMSGFVMGPFGPTIEQIRDTRLNSQLRIIDPEYEGDFFDTDEVEICLRGYGVTIPPNKDFVTAKIDMEMFEIAQTTAPRDLPNEASTGLGDGMNPEQNSDKFATEAPISAEPASVHCPLGMMGMAMGTMPPPARSTLPEEQWKEPSLRQTIVEIDVERLITCLSNSSVCFGRTPAVRPKDIRKALKESIMCVKE